MVLDLRFKLVAVPEGHGADDYEDDEGDAYTLYASWQGQACGELCLNLKDKAVLWVRWIEVPERWQRQGIGRALLLEVMRQFPNTYLDTGGATKEGDALWEAVTGAPTDN